MDYSGSMQYPAHIDHANDFSYGSSKVLDDDVRNDAVYPHSTTYVTYSPTSNYYGLFETSVGGTGHQYYEYDFANGWFNCIGDTPRDGNDNNVGSFNTVIVDGVEKQIGVSGNLLNFILTSRMDAAMMALIGGKACDSTSGLNECKDCTDSSLSCYRKAEGCRRYTAESNTTGGVDADFYVRPATYSTGNPSGTAAFWPDDWTSDSYPNKDLLVTILGHYRGQLTANDSEWCPILSGQTSNCKRRFERWNFTLDKTTRVVISLTGTWSGGGRLRVYDAASGNYHPNSSGVTGSPAVYQEDLPAGSYKVRVSSNYADKTGTYVVKSNVKLTPDSGVCNDCNSNTIGPLPYARVRVLIPGTKRSGVLNDTWSKARYGFMFYNGVDGQEGKLLVPCGWESSVTEFAKYLEGKKDTVNHLPYPYEGTPTGEALREAKRYFQQSGTGLNDDMHHVGTRYDPYYTWDTDTSSYLPVSCRKSYVVLISDGNWYYSAGGTLDPIEPAHEMHTADLRTDTGLGGDQFASVFAIWAFSPTTADDYNYGTRAMKWTAAYGGHRDLPGCITGWPYDRTKLLKNYSPSKRSVDLDFNISVCNYKTSSGQTQTPNACCKEWDLIRDNPTTAIPDNYFETRTGDQLKSAIASIVEKVDQQNASSSAVATVAQQTGEGDIVIRGMFQAKPPSDYTVQDQFLWWGHMEAYWPFTPSNSSQYFYDFETYDYVMCKDIKSHPNADGVHCWDAAMPSSLGGLFPAAANRNIFTYKNGTQTTFNTINITADDLAITTGTAAEIEAERVKIVNWVRGAEQTGKRSRYENQDSSRPQWVLGDLIYSTPVVVGPPSLGAVNDQTKALIGGAEHGIVACLDHDGNVKADCAAAEAAGFPRSKFYLNWRQTDAYTRGSTCTGVPSWAGGAPSIKHRDKFIFVGGNDGMIHAFLLSVYDRNNQKWTTSPADYDANTDTASDLPRILKIGTEVWAYLPSNLLTEVKDLADSTYGVEASGACSHRFMVDLAPRAWEVFFDNEATDSSKIPWHTVLIGGERGGGDMYFGLDVTDPYCPKVLWEHSVLKEMVAKFDFEAAEPAFRQACATGTAISPGQIVSDCVHEGSDQCCAPTIPSSWWNSLCDNCALNSGDAPCLNKLKELTYYDAVWTPFFTSSGDSMKRLPMTWSTPYVGRIKLPSGLGVNTCPPGVQGGVCVPKCGGGDTTVTGISNLAFIGGGLRVFRPETWMLPTDWEAFYKDGFSYAIWKPFMLALDVRTGKNLFKYLWYDIDKTAGTFFPEKKRGCDSSGANCTLRVPYAMSDPTVLDLWDSTNNEPGPDGYDDTIYVGDINGTIYGFKLNFDPLSAASAGIYVDLWKTKPIPVQSSTSPPVFDRESNQYRSDLQPTTVQPAVSLEPIEETSTNQPVRIVVGTGKYDDVSEGPKNDKTDVSKMALYNLRDVVDFSALEGSAWATSQCKVKGGNVPYVTGGDLVWRVRSNCLSSDCSQSTTYRCTGESTEGSDCEWPSTDMVTGATITNKGCHWYDTSTDTTTKSSDCCQSSCTDPCWQCVFDLLDQGEKIIGKPVIAGGVVYVTTFVPTTNDPCQSGGSGYLYAFDYQCRPIFRVPPEGTRLIAFRGGEPGFMYGARMSLGVGVPSQPVLDSTGKFIIVQTSQAEITRVELGPGGPDGGSGMPPPGEKMIQIKGWTERDQ